MPANPANPSHKPAARAAWIMLALLAASAILCPAAFAQWTEPDTPIRRLLKQADTNGDGQLSPDERQAAREKIRAFYERQQQLKSRSNLGSGDAIGRAVHAIPATIDPENTTIYKPKPGPHELIVIENHVLEKAGSAVRSTGEKRDIPLRITLPKADADNPLVDPPVVIFCHGALGSKDGYLALTEFWASHGYVVIQPTFGDSLSLMSPEEKQKITSVGQLLSSDHVTSQWDDRPREVTHIINQLAEIEKRVWDSQPAGALVSPFDREKIAVAGHWYGAHTTMLLTGAEPGHRPCVAPRLMQNPFIKAGIALSPQGTSPTFKADQFARFAVPMLFVTGDNDGSPMPGQLDKKGPWRREAFDHAPKGDRYLLWLNDAHHNLGGISGATFPGAGPSSPDHVLLVQSTTLAFLDAYLRNSPEAKQYLAADTLREASNDIAHIENKLTPGPRK